MTSETDAEFVENLVQIAVCDWDQEQFDRFFDLARRGAAMTDHERKQRAIMGDPLRGFHLACCTCGAKYARRGEAMLPDGRWVCSGECERAALPPPPAGETE